jgi:ABC-type multidrug transport system fused ATPase/permease subunit
MLWGLVAVLFVGGSILYAVLGILGARRLTHGRVAEGHNDVLVPLFLTAGVIYAVLLGFTVVAMWESYDGARANTAEEASLLVPLYRQSMNMAPEKGEKMRELIRTYAEEVTKGWDVFRVTGQGNPAARKTIDDMLKLFGTLTPATKVREIVAAQFLETFSQLMLDRNKRLLAASESLSWIMWLAAIGGGAVTIGMSFVLYMDRLMPHLIMTSVLSSLIGMLLFIMAVFNQPFVGPLGITAEPFEASLKLFDLIDSDFAQEPADAHQ